MYGHETYQRHQSLIFIFFAGFTANVKNDDAYFVEMILTKT
jgi:hypothetical protein